MNCFDWGEAKNAKLRAERGIGFEDIVFHIERGDLLDTVDHPNPTRHAGQRMFVVRRENYAYLVPFVEDEEKVFLKTIFRAERPQSNTLVRGPMAKKLDSDEKELLESLSGANGNRLVARAREPATRGGIVERSGFAQGKTEGHRPALFAQQRRVIADRKDRRKLGGCGERHVDLAGASRLAPPIKHARGQVRRVREVAI